MIHVLDWSFIHMLCKLDMATWIFFFALLEFNIRIIFRPKYVPGEKSSWIGSFGFLSFFSFLVPIMWYSLGILPNYLSCFSFPYVLRKILIWKDFDYLAFIYASFYNWSVCSFQKQSLLRARWEKTINFILS